ncbi:class IV adenylate cyclase [Nonomuraea sp. NPDC000554]|uniref:class IV adenylate cyclase n=1 Tax=Nonomuraea sp. NPDC000554 TaxID=3154259 RepID=UPI00332291EC
MKHIEVEQKYALADRSRLKSALEALGAQPRPAVRQVDTYYNGAERDFLASEVVSEWLRLRQSGQGDSINFKRWHPLDAVRKSHADEYESGVADIEAMRLMLDALGHTVMVVVAKTREEWTVPGTVEVAFDTVEGAGQFVEFEFKGDAVDADDANAQLDAFVTALGVELGERVHRGYPHMLLGRDH